MKRFSNKLSVSKLIVRLQPNSLQTIYSKPTLLMCLLLAETCHRKIAMAKPRFFLKKAQQNKKN